VVPPTGTADLHHVHRELAGRVVQPSDLVGRTGGTGDRTEPVAEDPGDVDDLVATAYRALRDGRQAVERRRLEEIGPGVAGVRGGGAPGGEIGEVRAALQRVVDDLAGSSHVFQRSQRGGRARCRPVTWSAGKGTPMYRTDMVGDRKQ